jgi:hypothetical protein
MILNLPHGSDVLVSSMDVTSVTTTSFDTTKVVP